MKVSVWLTPDSITGFTAWDTRARSANVTKDELKSMATEDWVSEDTDSWVEKKRRLGKKCLSKAVPVLTFHPRLEIFAGTSAAGGALVFRTVHLEPR